MMEPEIIQRFLESVGRKADVDLYLRLFQAQEKKSFAIIAADAQIVRTALDPFHFDLRILAGLGLCPVVLLGLFDAKDANRQAQRVFDWLVEDQVPARVVPSSRAMEASTIDAIAEVIGASTIPVVSLEAAREDTTDTRFDLLSRLASALGTRKVVFLSSTRGLEREGAPPISVVNLTNDYERLLNAKGQLARRHYTLLRQAKDLLDGVPQRMTIAVVDPLSLLRELFTVSGAGRSSERGRASRRTPPSRASTGRASGGYWKARSGAPCTPTPSSAESSVSFSRRTTAAPHSWRRRPSGHTCPSSPWNARRKARASVAISGR